MLLLAAAEDEAGGGVGVGAPDVLSHSAVRARNMQVLLAACHSPQVRGTVPACSSRVCGIGPDPMGQ